MNHNLLGKILATVATAAVDAELVKTNPSGVLEDTSALAELIEGFAEIWSGHRASGIPQASAPIKVGA